MIAWGLVFREIIEDSMNILSKQVSERNFYNIGLGKVITQN